MVQVWRDRLGEAGETVSRLLAIVLATLSRPRVQHAVRRAVILVAALWCTFSLVGIGWSLLPARPTPLPPLGDIVNPVRQATSGSAGAPIDVDRLAGWQLFGDPASVSSEALARLEAGRATAAYSRAGIEDDARETRLPLLLRGVVSSSDDGLGYAMIEHRGEQAVYAVGDALPVQGRVSLAKVLPSRVVVDNAGNYELLKLFEDNDLLQQAGAVKRQGVTDASADTAPVTSGESRTVQVAQPTLAAQYRDRLYSDPQSLAEVVQVAPVRSGADLVGYRLSPGRASEDFAALGFKPGDIVTAVNGLSLADPANTLRLYQAMRNERSAVFELQRDGSELVLSVQLPENGNNE